MKFLIIAGEHSGDILGGALVTELKKKMPGSRFVGTGGENMRTAGVDIIMDIEQMNVVGLWEIIKNSLKGLKLKRDLLTTAKNESINYAILIDYPGFNLMLSKQLKKMGIKIIYYVSPGIWIWGFKRIQIIKKNIELMLAFFPFEKEIYDKYKVKTVVTGHPYVERINKYIHQDKKVSTKLKSALRIPLDPCSKKICLMPGSRLYPIKLQLPILLNVASMVNNEMSKYSQPIEFLIPNVNKEVEGFILSLISSAQQKDSSLRIHYAFDSPLECIEVSDLVLLGTGSCVIETALLEKPMVNFIKINPISYFIIKRMIKVKFISLVNILAEKMIYKEFVQEECTVKNISDESIRILTDKDYRLKLNKTISPILAHLGNGETTNIAARAIQDYIKGHL